MHGGDEGSGPSPSPKPPVKDGHSSSPDPKPKPHDKDNLKDPERSDDEGDGSVSDLMPNPPGNDDVFGP